MWSPSIIQIHLDILATSVKKHLPPKLTKMLTEQESTSKWRPSSINKDNLVYNKKFLLEYLYKVTFRSLGSDSTSLDLEENLFVGKYVVHKTSALQECSSPFVAVSGIFQMVSISDLLIKIFVTAQLNSTVVGSDKVESTHQRKF